MDSLRPRRSDGISHSDAAHVAFDGSERLGLRKILPFVAQSPTHPITVYASHPPSPTTAQHSLPGGALPPYRGRSFTGRIASASPDAPEPEVRIHLPPAGSQQRTLRVRGVPLERAPFSNPPHVARLLATGPRSITAAWSR